MLLLSFFTLLPCAQAISGSRIPVATPEFTSRVYNLAYDFANHIQPDLTKIQQQQLIDALEIDATPSSSKKYIPRKSGNRGGSSSSEGVLSLTVDPSINEKLGDPSRIDWETVFPTVESALSHARSVRAADQPVNIALKAGTTHFVSDPIRLTSKDSFITFDGGSDAGEDNAVVSGGVPLTDLVWSPYKQSDDSNIYVADLKQSVAGKFEGLRVDRKRAVRARYPNGDPEFDIFPTGWASYTAGTTYKKPLDPAESPSNIVVDSPNRADEAFCTAYSSDIGNCNYVTGLGGGCDRLQFDPPSGYWCNSECPRGREYVARVPSGLTWSDEDSSVLNANGPFRSFLPNQTAVVNAFREGHWFSYVFLVDSISQDDRSMSWTYGGFQGGEGADDANEWILENLLELLDAPNEWFYDFEDEKLYYALNSTDFTELPPSSMVATNKTQVFEVVGDSMTNPIMNVTIQNIAVVDTKLSYLEPHGLPSDGGGDWALSRSGAVFVENAENTIISNNKFTRIDGNAVFISGYARHTLVDSNEFYLIGENAIVSWGKTKDFDDAKRAVPIPEGQGPDGTAGSHPQKNVIRNNFIHEIGHFQKQVSCYFQAQTQKSRIENNICFNGPRAGINFNDGMGGGNILDSNLIFNMVRETQDHGTFNSWDRQPFLSLDDEGKPTYVSKTNEITRNFMINDINSQEAVDNDDGSAYYDTHHNFFPFSSGGQKNDFEGHDNSHHHNIYYNTGNCMAINQQREGHEDSFYNNTCILNNTQSTEVVDYALFDGVGLDDDGQGSLPNMGYNTVITMDGKATENGREISDWQKEGHDIGTTVRQWNGETDEDMIIELAKEYLEF